MHDFASGGAELAGGFVVASAPAGFAIHQPVFADPHINYGLAENAVLLALARILRLLTLGAFEFGVACTGAHAFNLSRPRDAGIMTFVTVDYCKTHDATGPYFPGAL